MIHDLQVLTVEVHEPESWIVTPAVAPYDMDNLLLEALKETEHMAAEYQLQSLVLTGDCTDEQGTAPQGLRFTARFHAGLAGVVCCGPVLLKTHTWNGRPIVPEWQTVLRSGYVLGYFCNLPQSLLLQK